MNTTRKILVFAGIAISLLASHRLAQAAPPKRWDFNADGSPDYLLFNAQTGQTAVWNLQDRTLLHGQYGPRLPSGWTVACTADVNGDGHLDLVLVNPGSRQTVVWYLNNTTYISGAFGPTLPTGWTLVTATDINGDGHPDYILFNSSTRRTAVWYLNGTAFLGAAYGPLLPSGWSLTDANDFNGDGQADLVLVNASTRRTAIWYLNGTTFIGGAYGPTLPSGWLLAGTADFNQDGKQDYVLFSASTRRTAIWYLNGATFITGAYGPTLPTGWTIGPPPAPSVTCGSQTLFNNSMNIIKESEHNCMSCHDGSIAVDFRSYLTDEQGWVNAGLVKPGNPCDSTLYLRLIGMDCPPDSQRPANMPVGATPLEAADLQMIKSWIAQICD